jgi:hypothetical protein
MSAGRGAFAPSVGTFGGHVPVKQIKALEGLTGPLRVLLAATALLTVAAVASDVYSYVQYSALPDSAVFSETYLASDDFMFIVASLQLVLMLVTAIVFLMWVHRANANLRALSGVPMRFTPGWSVGWFFVPIMSLFRPYQVVREIWHVSHGTTGAGHGAVTLWWALFIVSGVVSGALSQFNSAVEDTADFLASRVGYLVTDSIDVAGLAVTLLMVMRIATAYGARVDETAPPLHAAMSGLPGVPVAIGPAVGTPGWGTAVTGAAAAGTAATVAAGTAATAAAPAVLPPVLPPAAWHPDPAGRHQLRWWDGTEWTEWVGDGGVMTEDPV